MNTAFKAIDERNMANGYRNLSTLPLSDEEIQIVIEAGESIGVDPEIFIFNDEEHLKSANKGTGYNAIYDKIFITKNVFPDEKSISIHPRDKLSVRAVLAHEYYGHRAFREEYLNDIERGTSTTPIWEDECRASINAALYAPNLTEMERALLLDDAIFRAKEYGQELDMHSEDNAELRKLYESIYGYHSGEKYIVPPVSTVTPRYSRIADLSFESAFRAANPHLDEIDIQTSLQSSGSRTEDININKYAEAVKTRMNGMKEDVADTIHVQKAQISHSAEVRQAKQTKKASHSHSFGMSL